MSGPLIFPFPRWQPPENEFHSDVYHDWTVLANVSSKKVHTPEIISMTQWDHNLYVHVGQFFAENPLWPLQY